MPDEPRAVLAFGSDGIGMLNVNGIDVIARAINFQAKEGEVPRLTLELVLLDVDVTIGALKIEPT